MLLSFSVDEVVAVRVTRNSMPLHEYAIGNDKLPAYRSFIKLLQKKQHEREVDTDECVESEKERAFELKFDADKNGKLGTDEAMDLERELICGIREGSRDDDSVLNESTIRSLFEHLQLAALRQKLEICDVYGNIEQSQQADNQNLRTNSKMAGDKIWQLKLNQVGVDTDVLAKIKGQKQLNMGAYGDKNVDTLQRNLLDMDFEINERKNSTLPINKLSTDWGVLAHSATTSSTG